MASRRAMLLLVALVAHASASASSSGTQLRGGALRAEGANPVAAPAATSTLRAAAEAAVGRLAGLVHRVSGRADPGKEVNRALEIKEIGTREAKHDEVPLNAEEVLVVDFYDMLMGVVVLALLTIVFAVLYNQMRVRPTEPKFGADSWKGEWKFGFFGCCDDAGAAKMCLISCCCPSVRWGDTMHMAKLFSSFWAAVALYFCLNVLSQIMGMLLVFILALVGAWYRQDLRRKFEIPNGDAESWCLDFLAYCCCPCLAITQEGRMVDEAWAHWNPVTKEAREDWEATPQANK